LEKVHGTSAHVQFTAVPNGTHKMSFFSGGESYNKFISLFNQEELLKKFTNLGIPIDKNFTIFGEAYCGSQQDMSHTYGPDLKFITFDVLVGDCWLDVPIAEQASISLGMEFVPYTQTATDLVFLDTLRDSDSEVSIRRGMGAGKKKEGIVLRPLKEMTTNNGKRIIAKHKRKEFSETKTHRTVELDPAKLAVLSDAEEIATEWVTLERLGHVLDKIPGHSIQKMREIINAMVEDVKREGEGEIVFSPFVEKAIGRHAAKLYQNFLKDKLNVDHPTSLS
jgi:hypothetical protein